jgi:hypothetical protein
MFHTFIIELSEDVVDTWKKLRYALGRGMLEKGWPSFLKRMVCFGLYKVFHPDAHGVRIRGLTSQSLESKRSPGYRKLGGPPQRICCQKLCTRAQGQNQNQKRCLGTSSDRLLHRHPWFLIFHISATAQTKVTLKPPKP